MLLGNNRIVLFLLMGGLLVFLGLGVFPGQAAADGDSLLYMGSKGEGVKKLQQDLSSLGFDTYTIDGIFGTRTYQAVLSFQKAKGIKEDGIVGPVTRNALNNSMVKQSTHTVQSGDTLSRLAQRYGSSVYEIKQANNLNSDLIYIGQQLLIPAAVAAPSPSRGGSSGIELLDWWTSASKVFAAGKVATITDVDTGISYRVIRLAGSNHADCQPLTAQDAAKMKQARGGYWSWDRRAIIVEVDGRKLAASQNGMPHGGQSIYDNNFPGHFCIHFLNSRTHGTNRVDENHQAMVQKAARV